MHLLPIVLLACGGKNTEPAGPTSPEAPAPAPAAEPTEVVVGSGSRAAPRAVWADHATDFALAFHRGTAAGNTAVSGLSAYVALSMLGEGSRGSTREAFDKALGAPLDEAFHIDNERALAGFRDTAGVKLSTANGLWVDQGVTLDPGFLEALGTHYSAPPTALPFASDPDAAAAKIDGWVDRETHHLIPTLFTPDELRGALFVLANAVAFDGKWATPFPEKDTEDAPFAGAAKLVPTMHLNHKLGYLDGEGYQAVVLPYDGDMTSLVLLLPDADSSLDALEQALTPELLRNAALARGARPIELALPRFELEVDHDLRQALAGVGLSAALDGGDYSGIGPGVQLGAAKQKVFLEVDEAGTKAAAVTGVVGTKSIPPPPIAVAFDRPFFFALWHKESNAPLFTGRIVDPS